MVVSACVVVESLNEVTGDRVSCVVRCLAGPVSLGGVFDTVTSADGIESQVNVSVAAIWRYGRSTDLLDAPHAAKLDLHGAGLQHLHRTARLSMKSGDRDDAPERTRREVPTGSAAQAAP